MCKKNYNENDYVTSIEKKSIEGGTVDVYALKI